MRDRLYLFPIGQNLRERINKTARQDILKLYRGRPSTKLFNLLTDDVIETCVTDIIFTACCDPNGDFRNDELLDNIRTLGSSHISIHGQDNIADMMRDIEFGTSHDPMDNYLDLIDRLYDTYTSVEFVRFIDHGIIQRLPRRIIDGVRESTVHIGYDITEPYVRFKIIL